MLENYNKILTKHTVFSIMYVCIYRIQNVFLLCPTPRLHCFLSSHWPSFRFLSFMAFFIPSIQFFFGLPRALFCFGILNYTRINPTKKTAYFTHPDFSAAKKKSAQITRANTAIIIVIIISTVTNS